MASSESNSFEEPTSTTTNTAIMPLESSPTQHMQNELEMETQKDIVNSNQAEIPQRSASYRGVRLSETDAEDEQPEVDDSWWSEVENNDLLLDQVPNVTSVFTPSPEAILEKSISLAESESVFKGEENFDRLHKIADKIKMTLNEHAKNKEIEEQAERERKLSETSDKESKTGYGETEGSSSISKELSLEEFKEELRSKRLQRQNAVQDLRDEIATLRRQLDLEREVNKRLRSGEHIEESSLIPDSMALTEGACAAVSNSLSDDEDPLSRSRHANIELANAQLALQMANSENISLRGELAVVQKQVVTLKEVIACCKQMLAVKEEQCNELKQRLTEIEKSFAEHEMKIMSDNLREEYERQLVNIRQLRQLYEERQRVAAAEYENLQRLISIKRDELAQEQEKSKNLEERNQNLMQEIETANNELACLRDECKEHKFEKAALKEEIGAVNTLFSQMVMGFNGKNNLDIDRLTTMLEENRTLLNDMATKECTDGATLPKLLFELVEQATQDGNKKPSTPTTSHEAALTDATTLGDKLQGEVMEDDEDEDGDSVTEENENDNENMAALTSNVKQLQQDEMPSPEQQDDASTSCNGNNTATPAAHTQALAQSHGNDVVDDVATNNTDGKVIVTIQNKIKKHHRKTATNNRKSSTSMSASGSAAAHSTMQQLQAAEVIGKVTSAQEIAGNLPKVWRVLMELLSHHKIDPVQFEENGKGEDCYKSVETPNGPKAELSVSKTYIKLKDLILEKKSLVKETNHLKTLNSHLDYRLNEQEKRLSAVSLELTKTWHLVGKMQRQHRQLHTQEQILRYQLQQKRRLLSELKDELEYCRRKWAAARAKNDESQEQCNDLRREFARRKLEDANNSAESGYSDSGGPASDEEVTVPAQVGIDVVDGELVKNIKDADDDDDLVEGGALAASTSAGGCVNYRRKRLREMFEHTRKIKRMQSTSPGRAGNVLQPEIVVLRWNSAPPTCGWRHSGGLDDDVYEEDTASSSNSSSDRGAIPKAPTRPSRRPKRLSAERSETDEKPLATETLPGDDRACRIQRLEQQCKTLIKQVLETSDNRERLEVQLKQFQDEMSPVQHAVPLEEIINKKRVERMTRASSVPITGSGSLTPREEEYTRKRSERLERLEEESRQLLSRIKRTSDRGHYLRCSLDRIRRAPLSREGSFESNTEDDSHKPAEEEEQLSGTETNSQANSQAENLSSQSSNGQASPLTAEEEAYTQRRAARLLRLEEESKQLLTKLSKNNQRGDTIGIKLDTLHERYKSQDETTTATTSHEPQPIAASSSQTPNSSGKMSVEQRIENIEKISSNREERLRLLEEEGRQLINKLSQTSEKGTKMINRIAERELNRQKRASSTPVRDSSLDNNSSTSAKVVNANSTSEETPVAAALLPTPKNVACTSIVSEELNERVTITTIPSQIAAHQGAIPKSKPTLQLLASRPKSARLQKCENKTKDNANESLEDMVRRLQSLPFPGKETSEKLEQSEENDEDEFENDLGDSSVKEDIEKLEQLNTPANAEIHTNQLKELVISPVAEDVAVVIPASEELNSPHTSSEQD
ncbi:227 kDa spindle- and centromere-associated protein [Calliphora vicina]|uniref:227 kDa spindle- and centromere-associated protein n=1 Tax=Calliphora vicina TaxID=7373 RepID=UPI00325A6ABA